MAPSLHVVACSHGTDNARGRELIRGLRQQVEELLARRPAPVAGRILVHEAYVDVQDPDLGKVLAGLPAGEPAVVVPLLLSHGHHTGVDIAAAVARRPNTTAASPIGADPRLARVMSARLREAGYRDGDQLVLAAAGTRVPTGQDQARASARALAAALDAGVATSYCSAATPGVQSTVDSLRQASPDARVGVVSYLLAPGFFQDLLAGIDATYVTAPLLPDVIVAECVVDRLEEVLSNGDFD